MDCPRPIKSVLPRFYPMWLSRTRPSMTIQRSEGLGSRLFLYRAYGRSKVTQNGEYEVIKAANVTSTTKNFFIT